MTRFILFLLLSISIVACNSSKEEPTKTVLKPVKYIHVGGINKSGSHTYTGLAKAEKEADMSFKVSGTLDRIYVKVGDKVKKGQLLAQLDATDYNVSYSQSVANYESSKAQIENAEAQLQSIKASFVRAESNYKRFEKLYETKSVSLSDFEQAKSSYNSAKASYNAAKTQIEAAKAGEKSAQSMTKSASNQVSYTRMRAPFSGVITRVNIEPNEIVGQGSPVLVINSITNTEVEIGVPENDISLVQPKQKVSVVFNSLNDESFEGIVREIGYASSGSTYPVTIKLLGNSEKVRPGMPASATFGFKNKNEKALIVPPGGVGKDGKGNFVIKLIPEDKHYKCVKTYVQIGELSDLGFEIKSGITSGDKVASAGLNTLRDNMIVKLYQKK